MFVSGKAFVVQRIGGSEFFFGNFRVIAPGGVVALVVHDLVRSGNSTNGVVKGIISGIFGYSFAKSGCDGLKCAVKKYFSISSGSGVTCTE